MGLLGGIKGAASGLARSRAQRQAPGQSKPIYRRWWALLLLAVVGINAVSSYQSYTTPPPAPPTAEQLVEKQKTEAAEMVANAKRQADLMVEKAKRDNVVSAVLSIKSNMHNPASFELITAMLMDDDAVCMEYRGTNGFGGIVRSKATAVGDRISTMPKPWNKHCTGRHGRDYAEDIRHML